MLKFVKSKSTDSMASSLEDIEEEMDEATCPHQGPRSPSVLAKDLEEYVNKIDLIRQEAFSIIKGKEFANAKTFARNYRECVDDIVHRKFKPWIQRAFPTLAGVHEDSFYNLVFSVKYKQKVSCSPFGTTEFYEAHVNDFVMHNTIVAGALLLLDICDFHMESETYDFAEDAMASIIMVVNKYVRVRELSWTTDFFQLFSQTYASASLYSMEQKHTLDRQNPMQKIFENFHCSVESYLVQQIYPDIPCHRSLIFLTSPIFNHLDDWHLLWLVVHSTFFIYCEDPEFVPGQHGRGITPRYDVMRVVNTTTRILLNMGDYLMCGIHCWQLVRIYFFLSLQEQDDEEYSAQLIDAALKMVRIAGRMAAIASIQGDNYNHFTRKLLQEGTVIKVLPYYWDCPGVYENLSLLDDICWVLKNKRCPRTFALRMTFPLLVIAARYHRLPSLPGPSVRPSQKDYLEMVLVIQMFYPPITEMALNVYAFEHLRIKYKHEYANANLKKRLQRQAFTFQLSIFPLLNNEVFIRNNCPSLHALEENFPEIEKIVQESKSLSKYMNCLKKKWNGMHKFLKSRNSSDVEMSTAPESFGQDLSNVQREYVRDDGNLNTVNARLKMFRKSTLKLLAEKSRKHSSKKSVKSLGGEKFKLSEITVPDRSRESSPEDSEEGTSVHFKEALTEYFQEVSPGVSTAGSTGIVEASSQPCPTKEAAGESSEAAGESSEAAGESSEAAGESSEAAGESSEAAGESSEAAGESSEAAGEWIPFGIVENWKISYDWNKFKLDVLAELKSSNEFVSFLDRPLPNERKSEVMNYKRNLTYYRKKVSLSDMFRYDDFEILNKVFRSNQVYFKSKDTLELRTNLRECLGFLIKSCKDTKADGVYTGDAKFLENEGKLKTAYRNLILINTDDLDSVANWMEDLQHYL